MNAKRAINHTSQFTYCNLTVGIFSICSAILIQLQTVFATADHVLSNGHDVGWAVGILFSVLFVAAGIINIVSRNSSNVILSVSCGCMYFVCGIAGIINSEVYADLNIWSFLAMTLASVSMFPSIYSVLDDKAASEGEQIAFSVLMAMLAVLCMTIIVLTVYRGAIKPL